MKSLFQNQRGVTLVEALVVVALVGSMGVMTLQVDPGIMKRSKNIEQSFSCEAHLISVMSSIRSASLVKEILDFRANGTNRYPAPNPITNVQPVARFQSISVKGPSGDIELASEAQLWPTSSDSILGTTPGSSSWAATRLRSALLINGSVRALAAMYNADPTICNTWRTPTAINTLALASIKNLGPSTQVSVNTQIKIEPYDVVTGVTKGCSATSLGLRPQGMGSLTAFKGLTGGATPDAFSPPSSATDLEQFPAVSEASGFSDTTGLRVSIRATGTVNGDNVSCERAYNFSYPVDYVAPAQPDHVVLSAYNVNGTAKASGDTSQPAVTTPQKGAGVTIQVGYANVDYDSGAQLLCRDVSQSMNENFACFANGFSGENPGPQKTGGTTSTLDSTFQTGSMMGATFYLTEYNSQWVPCESLTVCGKAPTSTGFVTPSGSSSKRYAIQNIYQQLKAGCRIHVQAISVDVAGNKSSPTSIRVVAGPSLETTRPVCGTTWCASS
ncbi:MAG: hypothetical protein AB7H97_00765, partial [Pseudobdellovibrionaceae bacterium]